jgi:hypothetical protein
MDHKDSAVNPESDTLRIEQTDIKSQPYPLRMMLTMSYDDDSFARFEIRAGQVVAIKSNDVTEPIWFAELRTFGSGRLQSHRGKVKVAWYYRHACSSSQDRLSLENDPLRLSDYVYVMSYRPQCDFIDPDAVHWRADVKFKRTRSKWKKFSFKTVRDLNEIIKPNCVPPPRICN